VTRPPMPLAATLAVVIGASVTPALAQPAPDGEPSPTIPAQSVTRKSEDTPATAGGRAEPGRSGKLESLPGGRAVVRDLVTTMTMERDGNVSFEDKPDIDIKLKLPLPVLDLEAIRKDLGRELTEWFRDPQSGRQFTPKSGVARHLTAQPGSCERWGDPLCDDANAPASERYAREQAQTDGSLLGGPMDISAAAHRKYIGDPYASRKLNMIDDTRDERVTRGGAFRADQLDRSTELVLRSLEQLWRTERDPVKRRLAAFSLWDECDEGSGPRGEAGQRARAAIIGWIRTRAPGGSPQGYTAAELERLQARRTSKQPFAPY
jgi:hypothetical protein